LSVPFYNEANCTRCGSLLRLFLPKCSGADASTTGPEAGFVLSNNTSLDLVIPCIFVTQYVFKAQLLAHSTAAGRRRRSRTPPPVAGRRRRLSNAADGRRTPPPVAFCGRLLRSPSAVDSLRRRRCSTALLSADVPRSGQPLLPLSVSRTVDSPCCHCLLVLVLVNSPCCYLSLVNSLRCFLER
jgi:hypothetical protein